MAYRFLAEDKSVEDGVRRIAADQIEKSIATLDRGGADSAASIHDVRKRCKKLRGLVRLVRPGFDDYKSENAFFRDSARMLSKLRDAATMLDTYDLVAETYGGQINRTATGSIRRRLTAEHKIERGRADIPAKFERIRARMVVARDRVKEWTLDDSGWAALDGGLVRTYERARTAMEKAATDPTAKRHHEWRKRTKYHWYHARLLERIWPGHMKMRAKRTHELSSLLGEHHDLGLFEKRLLENPETYGDIADSELMASLARRRMGMIKEQARQLGARVLAEPAEAVADRWAAWWKAWREEKPARETALTG